MIRRFSVLVMEASRWDQAGAQPSTLNEMPCATRSMNCLVALADTLRCHTSRTRNNRLAMGVGVYGTTRTHKTTDRHLLALTPLSCGRTAGRQLWIAKLRYALNRLDRAKKVKYRDREHECQTRIEKIDAPVVVPKWEQSRKHNDRPEHGQQAAQVRAMFVPAIPVCHQGENRKRWK